MNSTDDKIDGLSVQLKAWESEIAELELQHQAALQAAQQFEITIKELRAKRDAAHHQLQQLTLHKSKLYLWQNIGDGG